MQSLSCFFAGELMNNLQKVKKDTLWVQKVLQEHGATLADTWLLTVDQADQVVFYRKELG